LGKGVVTSTTLAFTPSLHFFSERFVLANDGQAAKVGSKELINSLRFLMLLWALNALFILQESVDCMKCVCRSALDLFLPQGRFLFLSFLKCLPYFWPSHSALGSQCSLHIAGEC